MPNGSLIQIKCFKNVQFMASVISIEVRNKLTQMRQVNYA